MAEILRNITEDKSSITLEELSTAFKQNDNISNILSPRKLRTYCVETRKNIIQKVEYAIKTLNGTAGFQEFCFDDEETLIGRKKKRRSIRKIS